MATFPPEISSPKGYAMVPYLALTDAEWQLIQPILPVPKRGPKRPHDRSVCAAFLFCRAAGVSIESLPLGQFPNSIFLRSTHSAGCATAPCGGCTRPAPRRWRGWKTSTTLKFAG